ncbi:MAG: carbohydrate-binding domain-containing protein [Clostridiales bacterium]|nr:carbohydrate-binding domain-containing protein [Clostridiales bacterium]
MKNKKVLAIITAFALLTAGCSAVATQETSEAASAAGEGSGETSEITVSDKDLDTSYDESESEYIELSEGTFTIDQGGTYIVTGSASDGQIIIEVSEEEDVHLILQDVSLTSSDSSPILILSADEVYITLEGENLLSNGGTFEMYGEEDLDALIYSKDDLTINGEGTLILDSVLHGIVCKDDMIIAGGTYEITAAEDGINTNDSLVITSGTLTVNAGGDGLHTDGILQIDGGTFDITAAEGLEGTVVTVNDGDIYIAASDDGINAAQKSDEYSPLVEIHGGNITIDMGAGDTDGIDSNGDITINGGTVSISGMSAVDYDGTAQLNGGTLIVNGEETDTIPNQFGGAEGQMPGDPGQGFPGGQGGPGGGGQPLSPR